jgi:hypothetical protein
MEMNNLENHAMELTTWEDYLGDKRKRIPNGHSIMDNPEKLATQGTQDEEQQNNKTTQYVLDTTIRKQTQIINPGILNNEEIIID